MKKFIRFGSIPASEKSLNYIKLTKDQRDDISSFIEEGKAPYEAALLCSKLFRSWENVSIDEVFEPGISAFYADENGLPILENMDQAQSLANRIGKDAFILSGDEVNKGQDGEPLVVNIKAEKTSIQDYTLQNVVIDYLSRNYERVETNKDMNGNQNEIYEFSDEIVYMGVRFKK